ncbi:hypothetical protein FHG87_001309 [Trinorchestia longiramus]|nr:hypothetical protein FHG87_001309 [Trinorchestia longiramus]
MKLTNEENASESSTVLLSAVITNSSLHNSSISMQNTDPAVNLMVFKDMSKNTENSFKNSSPITPGRSVNESVKTDETSIINSTRNFSTVVSSTTPHKNEELSSNASTITTSTVSTMAFLPSPSSVTTGISDAGHTDSTKNAQTDPNNRRRLLVAVVKTLVTTSITSSTSTVFSTCASGAVPTNACARRRKRRNVHLRNLHYDERNLHSSIQDPVTRETKEWQPLKRTSRLIMWSSSVQTVTFVTTSTNTDTTVSVSYSCSFSGIPAMCP